MIEACSWLFFDVFDSVASEPLVKNQKLYVNDSERHQKRGMKATSLECEYNGSLSKQNFNCLALAFRHQNSAIRLLNIDSHQ